MTSDEEHAIAAVEEAIFVLKHADAHYRDNQAYRDVIAAVEAMKTRMRKDARVSEIKAELKTVSQQMADHTKPQCAACPVAYSCCDAMYCGAAKAFAEKMGETIDYNEDREIPCLGSDGCTVDPWLRIACTLHTCEINSMGFTSDPAWDKTYFDLREKMTSLYHQLNELTNDAAS